MYLFCFLLSLLQGPCNGGSGTHTCLQNYRPGRHILESKKQFVPGGKVQTCSNATGRPSGTFLPVMPSLLVKLPTLLFESLEPQQFVGYGLWLRSKLNFLCLIFLLIEIPTLTIESYVLILKNLKRSFKSAFFLVSTTIFTGQINSLS